MISARITKVLLLAGLALSTTSWSIAQKTQNHPFLLSIQQTSLQPLFQVDFHNTGEQPLLLYLGTTIGNENHLFSIRLLLSDAKGKTLSLQASPPPIFGAAPGPLTLMIPAGANCSLPINMEDYISHFPSVLRLYLAPGQLTIQAVYSHTNHPSVMRSARALGPDGKQIEVDPTMPYWTGTVTSNTLPFTIAQKASQ